MIKLTPGMAAKISEELNWNSSVSIRDQFREYFEKCGATVNNSEIRFNTQKQETMFILRWV